jgi:hypothetical protein
MFTAYENMEMLLLDALAGDAPTGLLVLGTRTVTLDMGVFREGRRQVARVLRERWPDFQYARLTEFTTGYGPRAGGERRPHDNWLTKGIPDDEFPEAAELAAREWCRHVDALPARQYGAPLRTPSAALKYVIGHFGKESQRPPEGFTGQRFNVSRRYFGTTVRVMRQRAREAQALRRELWKAQQNGDQAHDAELTAQLALRRSLQTRWVLTNLHGARLSVEPIPEHDLASRLRKARAGRSVGRTEDGAGGRTGGEGGERPRRLAARSPRPPERPNGRPAPAPPPHRRR